MLYAIIFIQALFVISTIAQSINTTTRVQTTTFEPVPSMSVVFPTMTAVPDPIMTSVFPTPTPTPAPLPVCQGDSDLDVLNFALSLEYLENDFYQQGLSNYTAQNFSDAGFSKSSRHEIERIASHEKIHVTTLISVINSTYGESCIIQKCNYSFPVSTVGDFITLAGLLEATGSSAYVGKLSAINSKDFLTVAGQIAEIEARHSSYINGLNSNTGFPNTFEFPLDTASVFELAAPLITRCPYQLPFINPKLTLTGQNSTFVNVSSSASSGAYCAFAQDLAVVYTPLINNTSCSIPSSINRAYLFLTETSASSLVLSGVVAGPAVVEVGLGLHDDTSSGSGSGSGSGSKSGSGSESTPTPSQSSATKILPSVMIVILSAIMFSL